MPTFLVALAMAGSLAGAPSAASAADRIGPEFFGVDLSIDDATAAEWPEFAPGVVRVALAWSSVERAAGVYDWAPVDMKVATAEENQARPLLVIEGTPRFHALGPDAPTYGSAPRLSAYRSFVQALITRYGDRVDYQVWNEPNVPIFFTGTAKHAARMTAIMGRAARKASSDTTVVAPSFPIRLEENQQWFRRYWKQRVNGRPLRSFVDVANISAYPLVDGRPEDSIDLTRWARRVVDRAGFKGPLWASEINYGANGLAPTKRIPPGLQAAYVVRTYALHAVEGTSRVYWWRWEPHQTINTLLSDGAGNLTAAGRSMGVVREWLLKTKPVGCEVSRQGVYTCEFRVGQGVRRFVYWKRAGQARPVTAPAGAVSKTTTRGVTRSIKPGRKFRATVSPKMIEVQRSR